MNQDACKHFTPEELPCKECEIERLRAEIERLRDALEKETAAKMHTIGSLMVGYRRDEEKRRG